jgi:lysophospholipase L1-like esterase
VKRARRAQTARITKRVAKGAMIAFVAGTVGGAALLAAEAVAARSRRYAKPELGMAMRATVGPSKSPTLRLVLLGDTTALGVGVANVEETVGGHLAGLLADAGATVAMSSVAVSGSRSGDLATQVARALLGERPDLAVILVGANDATRLARSSEVASALGSAVRRLREAGAAVVVGTCPDLGAVRAVAPPLRQIMGWCGRRIARAQAVAALMAGARVVDLGAMVGPVFRADPGMLCYDGFHPSADGYRVIAHALFPETAAAANLASSR